MLKLGDILEQKWGNGKTESMLIFYITDFRAHYYINYDVQHVVH